VSERERNLMDLRAMMGLVLALLGVVCAVVGIFVLAGISIEFPGIILGGWVITSVSRARTGRVRS
jgi:hypothetical protein